MQSIQFTSTTQPDADRNGDSMDGQMHEDARTDEQHTVEEVALEVDHMILDYVAFNATKAVLNNDASIDRGPAVHQSLSTVDTFLKIFRTRHPQYRPDPELSFRLSLLKLSTLFTQRFVRSNATPPYSALEPLRQQNSKRARDWIDAPDRVPSKSMDNVERLDELLRKTWDNVPRTRADVLTSLKMSSRNTFYGEASCVSLLDILPSFMRVSAACNAICGSSTTLVWMELAGLFMLQAVLEQYLVFGAEGTDMVDEAFAWGYKRRTSVEDGRSDDDEFDEVDAMFEGDDSIAEVPDWGTTKFRYLSMLVPDIAPSEHMYKHLEQLSLELTMADFHMDVVRYLTALMHSTPSPVLLQVENGQLMNMTQQETRELLATCGIGT